MRLPTTERGQSPAPAKSVHGCNVFDPPRTSAVFLFYSHYSKRRATAPSGHFSFPESVLKQKTSINARSHRCRSSLENLTETLFDSLHIRTIVLIQTREIHFTRFIGVERAVRAKRREHQDATGAPIHRAMFGVNKILHERLVLR
jgi:hypothetical protein